MAAERDESVTTPVLSTTRSKAWWCVAPPHDAGSAISPSPMTTECSATEGSKGKANMCARPAADGASTSPLAWIPTRKSTATENSSLSGLITTAIAAHPCVPFVPMRNVAHTAERIPQTLASTWGNSAYKFHSNAARLLEAIVVSLTVWACSMMLIRQSNRKARAGMAAEKRRTAHQGDLTSSGPWKGMLSSRRAFLLGTALFSFCVGSALSGPKCPAGHW